MPITPPSIGSVVTPAGFTALSAQGLVQLVWNQSPLATTYYVNRSIDNVTFTTIAQTSSLSYNDSTGILNTIYYYTVQAATSLASSQPTVSLAAQSLKPGQTTLGNLRTQAQQRTDLTYNTNITTQEWNQYLSDSYKWLYNLILQKFGNDYYVQIPFTYTTTGQVDPVWQANVYPLPNDFYKMLRVEVALNPADPNSWITLRKFEAINANLYNYPNQYTLFGITDLRYRIWGPNLQIVPIASAGQTLRIWYAPRPDQLINDTDIVDGLADYEELVVVDAGIKALAKQESDVTVLAAQKMEMIKDINDAAENRDIGSPETVSDIRRRNFAWGGDEGDGGSGWGY